MTADHGQSTPRRRGLMLVMSSPSGAGKTSISRRTLELEPELTLSISVTTRPRRPAEREGVHYHFIDATEFAGMVEGGELLEHATVYGHEYGTPRRAVEDALSRGRDVLFDIDWQGAQQLREAASDDTVGVFILPPSLDELSRRLRTAGPGHRRHGQVPPGSGDVRRDALGRVRLRADQQRLREKRRSGAGDPRGGAPATKATAGTDPLRRQFRTPSYSLE